MSWVKKMFDRSKEIHTRHDVGDNVWFLYEQDDKSSVKTGLVETITISIGKTQDLEITYNVSPYPEIDGVNTILLAEQKAISTEAALLALEGGDLAEEDPGAANVHKLSFPSIGEKVVVVLGDDSLVSGEVTYIVVHIRDKGETSTRVEVNGKFYNLNDVAGY